MKNVISLLGAMCMCFSVFASCGEHNYKSLSVDKFKDLLQKDNVQLVDVRTEAEYTEGHIPGALNINVMNVSFANLANDSLRKDSPVAVYCRSGKRSKRAAEILSKKGYKVYELNDGFNSWEEAGNKIER